MYPFRRMKAIFLGLLMVLMASHAGAQTPQDKAYVETRKRLVADLEAKRESPPGPPTKGCEISRSNPDPACCGKGAESLDALAISKDKLRAVMTTEGILKL